MKNLKMEINSKQKHDTLNIDYLMEENDPCLGASSLNPPNEENTSGALETKGSTSSHKIGHWHGMNTRKPSKERGPPNSPMQARMQD